ncbi:MAG TPA: haloacid dehalogenase type II [Acidimicrobiales bacterium]|nr:haloacid dehalogenase type II [Acidimicrobiales bacterium]
MPSVVVFDVNETLSDLAPMADRFEAVGAPGSLAATWFSEVLRDGFALTATGGIERFAVLGEQVLRSVLHGRPLRVDTGSAVTQIMSGFTELDVHPDVPAGVRGLRDAGLRLVTLSNGAASVARALLDRAGLGDQFEQLLSVEDAGVWKPAPDAYRYAAARCGAPLTELVLAAVHPWDIHGASRAGLATAWINRTGAPYPSYFDRPTWEVAGVDGLAGALRP